MQSKSKEKGDEQKIEAKSSIDHYGQCEILKDNDIQLHLLLRSDSVLVTKKPSFAIGSLERPPHNLMIHAPRLCYNLQITSLNIT